MQNRTDLALELKEEKNIGSAQSGIIVKTRIDTTNHIKETKIIIKNKKGEDSLGNLYYDRSERSVNKRW